MKVKVFVNLLIFELILELSLFSITNTLGIKNENDLYIKEYNQTHFSCDSETKIFNYDKLNDDTCDCDDGKDENSTTNKYNL